MKQYAHPDIEDVSLVKVMHALSDSCRLKIVSTLIDAKDTPLACNEFELDVSKATASHHFEVLRSCGITKTETQGTKCMTSLRSKEFETQFPGIIKLVAQKTEEPIDLGSQALDYS